MVTIVDPERDFVHSDRFAIERAHQLPAGESLEDNLFLSDPPGIYRYILNWEDSCDSRTQVDIRRFQ